MQDDLAARFDRFLAAVEPERGGTVTSCEAITGGYSRISARAAVTWGDGTQESFVLRGDPPPGSGVFTSDRDEEYRMLQALTVGGAGAHAGRALVRQHRRVAGLQVPRGGGRRRSGLAAGRRWRRPPTSCRSPTCSSTPSPRCTPSRWTGCRRTFRARPTGTPTWTACSPATTGWPTPSPARRRCCGTSGWWAATHRPPPVPLGFVHGDCQPTNVLVADDAPPLVIDFEFAHIGDPREDIGYYTQNPLAPERLLDRSGALPRPLSRTDRAHRGATQPRRRRILPDHRHGQVARAVVRRRGRDRRTSSGRASWPPT